VQISLSPTIITVTNDLGWTFALASIEKDKPFAPFTLQIICMYSLYIQATFYLTVTSIKRLKNHNTPDEDGIQGEILKFG